MFRVLFLFGGLSFGCLDWLRASLFVVGGLMGLLNGITELIVLNVLFESFNIE